LREEKAAARVLRVTEQHIEAARPGSALTYPLKLRLVVRNESQWPVRVRRPGWENTPRRSTDSASHSVGYAARTRPGREVGTGGIRGTHRRTTGRLLPLGRVRADSGGRRARDSTRSKQARSGDAPRYRSERVRRPVDRVMLPPRNAACDAFSPDLN